MVMLALGPPGKKIRALPFPGRRRSGEGMEDSVKRERRGGRKGGEENVHKKRSDGKRKQPLNPTRVARRRQSLLTF